MLLQSTGKSCGSSTGQGLVGRSAARWVVPALTQIQPVSWTRAIVLAAAIILSITVGCDRTHQTSGADSNPPRVTDTNTDHAAAETGDEGPGRSDRSPDPIEPTIDSFRIISLSPAVTDMLIDLGLADHIVGRDRWEAQLPDDVPKVGDLTQFNREAFIALRPTDVIIQAGDRGAPAGLVELAEALEFNLINLQIDGLADITGAMNQVVNALTFAGQGSADSHGAPSSSSRSNLERSAAATASDITSRIESSLAPLASTNPEAAATFSERGVLLLHSLDPPQAFGPGSYLDDVLARLGVQNALSEGGPWQRLDFEAVTQLDPWAIILVSPKANPDWTPLARLTLKAVDADRIGVLDHPQALLPGSSVAEVAADLRVLLVNLHNQSLISSTTP